MCRSRDSTARGGACGSAGVGGARARRPGKCVGGYGTLRRPVGPARWRGGGRSGSPWSQPLRSRSSPGPGAGPRHPCPRRWLSASAAPCAVFRQLQASSCGQSPCAVPSPFAPVIPCRLRFSLRFLLFSAFSSLGRLARSCYAPSSLPGPRPASLPLTPSLPFPFMPSASQPGSGEETQGRLGSAAFSRSVD